MKFKSSISLLLCLFSSLSILSEPREIKNVLIVSDQDGIEWNVADYLESYFTNKGYEVKNILISECTKDDYACHGIVIMMNVIKDNKVPQEMLAKIAKKQKLAEETNETSIFFISTISGEEWDGKNRMIDGITKASEMIDAEPIAKRIIEKVKSKLNLQ